jgi:hypothetical protein
MHKATKIKKTDLVIDLLEKVLAVECDDDLNDDGGFEIELERKNGNGQTEIHIMEIRRIDCKLKRI